MNKLFEVVFLDESFEFLSHLEKKHYKKILLIFESLKPDMIQNYLKS